MDENGFCIFPLASLLLAKAPFGVELLKGCGGGGDVVFAFAVFVVVVFAAAAELLPSASAVVTEAEALFKEETSEPLNVIPGALMPLVIDSKSRRLVRVRTELKDCAMDGLMVEMSKIEPSRDRVPGGDKAGINDVALYVLANLKDAPVRALARGPLDGGACETMGVSESS